MSNFCENCGKPLNPGDRFCENCGAEVPDYVENDFKNCYQSLSEEPGSSGTGTGVFQKKELILTDLGKLSASMGVEKGQVLDVLNEYISSRSTGSVIYRLLDASDDRCTSVEDYVALLKKVRPSFEFDYLFIVGSEKVIPVGKVQNECTDQATDEYIYTDFPYSSLSVESPWENFEECNLIMTGRLPVYDGESLEEFAGYMDSAAKNQSGLKNAGTFGLSAAVWADTSSYVYGRISDKRVELSPSVVVSSVKNVMDSDLNLLFFNLHGASSSDAMYWYGQDGENYPEAFGPDSLKVLNRPYVIGVEACYGARYAGYAKENSVLYSAMTGGCLNFLGSSCIAYGSCEGEGNCADIMVGGYLECIKSGYTGGEAFCLAKSELLESDEISDSEVKTLIEFALYGDPSLAFFPSVKQVPDVRTLRKPVSRKNMGFSSVRNAVEMELCSTDSKIRQQLMEIMSSQHKEFDGIEPEFYISKNGSCRVAVFTRKNSGHCTIIKEYIDRNGKIIKELMSK